MDQVEEPTLLQTVRGHSGEVTCVDAFGARLVTGGGDRVLRLYSWASSEGWVEAAAARAAHRYGVTAARWSPHGVLVASAGVDGALRVWCGRTLKACRVLAAAGAAAVRAVCWAGGGRLLAGHDDGALRVWRVSQAALLARLQAHEGALYAIAAPAGGALLLTACTEGVLKVFDLVEVCRAGESTPPAALYWEDGAHDLGAMAAADSPDQRHAATGGHDAKIRIWRVHIDEDGRRSVQAAGNLEGHSDSVTALRWGDGALLASSALDRTARLWLPHQAACLHVVHAHARYLTCIALSADLRYMVTGSNDKTVRMWTLGSLTLDGILEPPCDPLAHFGLGDLEGIGPVDEDEEEEAIEVSDGMEESGAQRVWQCDAHAAPINCIATHGDLIATASSDGLVKIFRWSEEDSIASLEHSIEAHEYPALACDFGAGGAVLLSAGLDGFGRLWDVEMGCLLRSLSARAGGGAEGGGGGVRGARAAGAPARLLLATDDGLAPLWALDDPDPLPQHVFAGHAEAATCCAWAGAARALAVGGAAGELAVRAPPPAARDLHIQQNAHEGGVQSCDFAASGSVEGIPDGSYLLASAGADSLLKLWLVELDEKSIEATVTLSCVVLAHGNGVAFVRWGEGGRLASAGGDEWARVWRVEQGGREIRSVAAVPAAGAGGAPAVALLPGLLAVGSLTGELALWRLPEGEAADAGDADSPRFWDEAGVARWLHEYITRVPGVPGALGPVVEAALARRARDAAVTGARLLDDPVEELLAVFGYGDEEAEGEEDNAVEVRTRLVDELYWLRQLPPPATLAWSAPHGLLCPISHRLLDGSSATRAADGRTYSRAARAEWALAKGAACSPATGRRMRSTRLAPNYRLTTALRAYLQAQLDT